MKTSTVLVSIAALLLLVGLGAGCFPEERLYEPCSSTSECETTRGLDSRCVVSPYDGQSLGFCSVKCLSRAPGVAQGECVDSDACSTWEAEGCCYISHVDRGEGAGFCVPFDPPADGF